MGLVTAYNATQFTPPPVEETPISTPTALNDGPQRWALNEMNGPWQWNPTPTTPELPPMELEPVKSNKPLLAPVVALNATLKPEKNDKTSTAHKGTVKQQALYEKVLIACGHLPPQAAKNIARLIAYRECNANEADPLKARDIGDGAGLTAAGITQKYNPTLDFNNLPLKDIVDTYYEKYWFKENMDQYADNPMRQAMLFDACVGMGPKDMKEVDRIAQRKSQPTAQDYGEARRRVYERKPNWEKFGPGWTNRVNKELVPYAQSLG